MRVSTLIDELPAAGKVLGWHGLDIEDPSLDLDLSLEGFCDENGLGLDEVIQELNEAAADDDSGDDPTSEDDASTDDEDFTEDDHGEWDEEQAWADGEAPSAEVSAELGAEDMPDEPSVDTVTQAPTEEGETHEAAPVETPVKLAGRSARRSKRPEDQPEE